MYFTTSVVSQQLHVIRL